MRGKTSSKIRRGRPVGQTRRNSSRQASEPVVLQGQTSVAALPAAEPAFNAAATPASEPTKDSAPKREARPPSPPATGLAAVFEAVLRRFKVGVHLVMLIPLYALACACMGLAAAPGVLFYQWVARLSGDWSLAPRIVAHGTAVAGGFFIYGFAIIFIAPALNFVLRARAIAWRGPYYSAAVLRWYIHNGLIYLVRYSFLEFVTPTPLSLLFYEMMGMKIGEGSQINSTHISDASLIELGRNVTIGGSATIVAHYGMGGYLVIAPVKIGDGATIGLKATIMGGVEIGEKAKVMPNSVVLPRTKIPAGETWGGVPARKIDLRKAA